MLPSCLSASGGAFFGGGWAIIATYSLLFLFGQTFIESADIKQFTGIGIAIVAILVFAFNQIMNWSMGIVLLLGMMIGAYIGASYGIKKGNRWVRTLFSIVTIAFALKLLF